MNRFSFAALAAAMLCFAACNPPKKEIAPSGISLSPTAMSLTEGETGVFSATVSPSDATYQSIDWKSSSPQVATVSNGTVTAVAPGTAVITASTSGVSASADVIVSAKPVHVTLISLDRIELSLKEGETATLTPTIEPAAATDKSVTWSSDNTSVATVSDGKVTAVKAGTATISVKTADGGKVATCVVTVTPNNVPVFAVVLTRGAISLVEGGSTTLTAYVVPENASNKNVTWTSSNTSVATVTQDGTVTAVKAGTADITVTTADGGETATCVVTVHAKLINVTGVTLNKTSLSLSEGSTETLIATITPSDAHDKIVTWTSSNTSVATVTDGKVTGVKAGTATITVKTDDGHKTATCAVTVTANKVAVTGVTLNKTTLSLVEGNTETLTATVAPSTATNKNVTWTSSNTSVATVTDGKVTAVKAGSATITVKTADGSKTATCAVTVTAKTVAVTGVTLNKTTLSLGLGESETLTAAVAPSTATNKNVTWTSSNTAVATVSNGKVTGVKTGTATITVKTADGAKTATCAVTVKDNSIHVQSISLDQSQVIMKKIASSTPTYTTTLRATVYPSNATNKNIKWKSSNPSVATVQVSSTGGAVVTVTGVGGGTTSIVATSEDGGKEASCMIMVKIPILKVELDMNNVTIREDGSKGETVAYPLKAIVYPSDATETLNWNVSGDIGIYSISPDKRTVSIYGKKVGSGSITAQYVEAYSTVQNVTSNFTVGESSYQVILMEGSQKPSVPDVSFSQKYSSMCDKVDYMGQNVYKLHFTGPVDYIPANAFKQANYLTKVTFPAFVKEIGNYAFNECKNLTTIDFNEGLEIIGYAAFASDLWSDKGPKYFTLPKSLKEIRHLAFKDVRCTDLVIPENVEVIDTRAFWDCGAVKTITLKCKTPPAVSNSASNPGKYYEQFSIGSGYPKIRIPASMVSAYRNSVWWNYYIVNNQYLTY